MFRLCVASAFVLTLIIAAPLSAQEPAPTIHFDRVIAPLLAAQCLDCHSGPRPKGGLDLATEAGARKGGKKGPALVRGSLDKSLVWERVESDRMPPKHPLSGNEKQILKEWIEKGGAWGTSPIDRFRYSTTKRAGVDWWSFQAIRRPPVPDVKDKRWPTNPIDHFIAAKLDAAGLRPSPPAHRRALLRRLCFDLTGLPPTPEEVDAFIADKRDDAYERQVERLLASPHYGERWGRHWLDVVRFGESDGFERNAARANAWPYRNWVIDALNADMPYDQFVRMQIAGDVLFPGDSHALSATGYLVAGIHNTVLPMNKAARETAAQDELEDLVGNVGQTFLGLTIHCARCHDHKFDPVSQKDYYRLASALSGIRHGERDIPVLVEQEKRLTGEIALLEKEQAAIEEPARQSILEERRKGKRSIARAPAPIASWDFREGLKDRVGEMHASLVGGARLTPEGLQVDGKSFARTAPLTRDLREKTLEAWVRLGNRAQRGGGVMTVQTPEGDTFDAIVYGEKEPETWLAGSDFFRRTQSFGGPAEPGTGLVHVAVTYAADGTISGYRDGKPYGKPYRVADIALFPAGKATAAFGIRHLPAGGNRMLTGIIQKARLYDRALSAEEIALSAEREDFVPENDLAARLDPTQTRRREEIRAKRITLADELGKLKEKQKGSKVYVALSAQPPVTRILTRGQVTDPGEVVPAGGVSSAAGKAAEFGLPADAFEGDRRKKLADWIVDAENPLFARVFVNRLWHHHFGVGLVETPSDFGFNGGRPSHPELLDWLAAEFKESGYRMKAMHRLMVTSSAYRQSSLPSGEGLAKDVEGRLLWRRKPMRMEGEVLRDSMLAIAGLLNREVGGKGFSDYKEKGGAGTSYYDPFDPVGEAFHRRSIYRFQPRSASVGLLDAFDCPDPASSSPRRNVTTTPLQALALWNGPFALRMADALAERIAKEAPGDVRSQITRAYRLAYQRTPDAKEAELCRRLVEAHGLRPLCRVLLNSNEFLTID